MPKKEELSIKVEKVRDFMDRNGYAGALFGTQHNFSWLTCGGDDQIVHGTELGLVQILITKDRTLLITNNIEMPRVTAEETSDLPLEKAEYVWTEGSAEEKVKEAMGGGKLAADFDFPGAVNEAAPLSLLRVPLLDGEVERYRKLAGMCTSVMEGTMREIAPGMSEFEIQGLLGGKLLALNIIPIVLLVGTDERIINYRHPMPTEKKLNKYCMAVICAQRWGMVLNMSRLVHFGPLSGDIEKRYDALLRVDMAYTTATKPGNSLEDVFEAGKAEYANQGFPGEERKHFQGGTCGYLTRELSIGPVSPYVVRDGEIFAHCPSITGTKTEDSIMIKNGKYEVLTRSKEWPSRTVEYGGVSLERPEILIR